MHTKAKKTVYSIYEFCDLGTLTSNMILSTLKWEKFLLTNLYGTGDALFTITNQSVVTPTTRLAAI